MFCLKLISIDQVFIYPLLLKNKLMLIYFLNSTQPLMEKKSI